jgi:hypothetical protein
MCLGLWRGVEEWASLVFLAFALVAPVLVSAQGSNDVVPNLISFSGALSDSSGKPMSGTIGVTFSLYKDQEGGSPLWIETQNVQADRAGHYSAMLGSTLSHGLPSALFVSGEARWLEVQAQGYKEQPRVMLLAVPYAMKAADAQTVGGLPPSAFVLASPNNSSGNSNGSNEPIVGGSGTQNYIPLWTDNSGDLGNSILYQVGSGSSAKIGINLKNPLFTLDVNGQELVRGLFEMATTGFATAGKGYTSNPFNIESSAFNSGTGKYTLNHFQWQAEPTGNNTANPSATLNLLFGTDPGSPAETGLKLSSNGLLTFAPGQTFPGTGTITGVTTASGSGLVGGGNSGSLNLSLTNACSTNQTLQWNGSKWVCSTAGSGTISGVTAGTDLTGGGTSGSVTLNVDTTKIPQLSSNNTFTGSQAITTSAGVSALSVTEQATSGQTFGILATTESTGNRSAGVLGQDLAPSGIAFGVEGYIADNDGAGVFGADGNPLSQTGGSLSGTFGSGLWGDGSSNGLGMVATADGNYAVFAANTNSTYAALLAENRSTANGATALAPGVFGISFAPVGLGVVGSGPVHSQIFGTTLGTQPFGMVGDSVAGDGVLGTSDSGVGVIGVTTLGTGTQGWSTIGDGVYGFSTDGTGIHGVSGTENGVFGQGNGTSSGGAGVYASGYNTAAGVYAIANGIASAVIGINGTTFDQGQPTALFLNSASANDGGGAFTAGGSTTNKTCTIYITGDLVCSGTKSAAVQLPDSRWVRLYAVESPENWFEDFGSSSLANGKAAIALDPTFRETVNSSQDYHVFLTPRGECDGLYVAQLNANGFEVRELHHGTSNVAFDYRIVARRKGYEDVRLADVTDLQNRQAAVIHKTLQQVKKPAPAVTLPRRAASAQLQKLAAPESTFFRNGGVLQSASNPFELSGHKH